MQTEVLLKEQLDAEIGGDYIAASADFRDGDDAETVLQKELLTQKSEATKTPPPPISGSVRSQELLQKKLLTQTSEATTSPPPPTTGAKQWGPVFPVLVFEIVDLERETQAAVFLRWLITTTIILKLRSFLKIPCRSFFGVSEVVLVKNT